MRHLIERLERLVEGKSPTLNDFKKFTGTPYQNIGSELANEIGKALRSLSLKDVDQVRSTIEFILDDFLEVATEEHPSLRGLASSLESLLDNGLKASPQIRDLGMMSMHKNFDKNKAKRELQALKSLLGA